MSEKVEPMWDEIQGVGRVPMCVTSCPSCARLMSCVEHTKDLPASVCEPKAIEICREVAGLLEVAEHYWPEVSSRMDVLAFALKKLNTAYGNYSKVLK